MRILREADMGPGEHREGHSVPDTDEGYPRILEGAVQGTW